MVRPNKTREPEDESGIHHAVWMILIVVVLLGLYLIAWVGMSHQEAAAYNRLTGANVSTWDAMWIQLPRAQLNTQRELTQQP